MLRALLASRDVTAFTERATIMVMPRLRLPDRRRRAMEEAFASLKLDDLPLSDQVAQAGHVFRDCATPDIMAGLKSIRQPNGPPVLLIDNLAFDASLDGPAPFDGKRPIWMTPFISGLVVFGAIDTTGLNILAYDEEYGGELVQHLVPAPGLEGAATGRGRAVLDHHTDNAFLAREHRPDGLVLFGLKNPNGVATQVAPLDDLLRQIAPCHIDTLRRPYFATRSPMSFHADGSPQIVTPARPVLYIGPRGELEVQVSLFNCEIVSHRSEALAALNALREALSSEAVQPVGLQPGTLMMLSNTRALHGRGEVTGDRWIIRAYYRESLAELDAIPGARAAQPNRYHVRRLINAGREFIPLAS
jgi:L-asparagine oxygenase